MNSVIEKVLSGTFKDLTQTDLQMVFNSGRVIIARAKEVITDPTDNDHSLYICLSGIVKVNYSDDSGEEVSLTYLKAGEIFGELSAIDEQARSASCIAKTDCSLLKISQSTVHRLLTDSAAFNRALLVVLIDRIRKTDKKLYSIAKRSAGQRVTDELIHLAQSSASHPDQAEIPFIPKQQELGLLAMVSREKASRTFNELRKLGLIEKQEDRVEIPSLTRLRQYLEQDEY